MNIKNPGLILVAMLLLHFGCRKSEIETIRMHGSVSDSRSGLAIEGIELTLQSAVLEDGIFHNDYQDVDNSITDAAGFYSFETETKKAVKYRVQLAGTGYFELKEEFDPFDITSEESYLADFTLAPYAYLQLNISNTSPWDNDDQITWSLHGLFSSCFDCCGSGIEKGEGPVFNTSKLCRLIGDQWLELSWTVTKNNNTKNYTDSLWVSSFDTIPYSISY